MIERYEVKTVKNEEVLYLHFSFDYEFANELFNKQTNKSFVSSIVEYIKNHNITFDGKKICLVIGGIMVSLLLTTAQLQDIQANKQPEVKEEMIIHTKPDHFYKTTSADLWKYATDHKVNLVVNDGQIDDSSTQTMAQSSSTKTTTQAHDSSHTTVSNSSQTPASTIEEAKTLVTVVRSNGTVVKIELEEYLIGVVGAEMPVAFHSEALKAQAVAARTYALKRISQGQALTDTVSTQVYKDNSQLQAQWGSSYTTYYNKVKSAVEATKGQILIYGGTYIDAVYHSTSNGYTADASEVWGYSVPYLKQVASPWDTNATTYSRVVEQELATLSQVLGITITEKSAITVMKTSASGRVDQLQIGETVFSGTDLYKLLNLRSRDFTVQIIDGKVVFEFKGYGHGVGMSQYGANGMANGGYQYDQILKHYYTGVQLVNQ